MAIGTMLRMMFRGKQETCEACQGSFPCGPPGSCWCGQEKVPAETLQKLKGKYKHCLCPTCLRNAAALDRD
jgi:hypothetical protein